MAEEQLQGAEEVRWRPFRVVSVNYGRDRGTHRRVEIEGPELMRGEMDPDVTWAQAMKAIAEGRAKVVYDPVEAGEAIEPASEPTESQNAEQGESGAETRAAPAGTEPQGPEQGEPGADQKQSGKGKSKKAQ